MNVTLTRRGRALLAIAVTIAVTVTPSNPGAITDPQEDEAGWDCRIRGDHSCGPTDTALCGPVGNPLGCPTWVPSTEGTP